MKEAQHEGKVKKHKADKDRIAEMVGMMNGVMPKKKKKYVPDEEMDHDELAETASAEGEESPEMQVEEGDEGEEPKSHKGLFGRASKGLSITIALGRGK